MAAILSRSECVDILVVSYFRVYMYLISNPWWRHQMEKVSVLLALCEGNHRPFPHKGRLRGAVIFSFIYNWANGCANNRDAGDLRQSYSLWRHCNVLARCLLWIIIASSAPWRVKSRHLDRLFNNLFRVTAKKTLNVLITAPLRNPPVNDTWIPHTNGQQLCVWFDYVLHVEMI